MSSPSEPSLGSDANAPQEPRYDRLAFGQALELLREGGRVSRRGWNGRGQYLECQYPDMQSKMTHPYIFIHTVQGGRVPWVASQTDLLAMDWLVVTERTVLVFGHPRQEIG